MKKVRKKTILWGVLALLVVILIIGFAVPLPFPSDGPFGYQTLPEDVDSLNDMHGFKGSDGTVLAYRLIPSPSGITSRGILVFFHGGSIHSGWYTDMARKIAEAGIIVYLPDLRGHGRFRGRRGHIPSSEQLMDDIEKMILLAKKQNPGLPLFLGGHCAIAERLIEFQIVGRPTIDGLILMTPAIAGGLNNEIMLSIGPNGVISFYFLRLLFPNWNSIKVNWHHDIKDLLMVKEYPLSFFKICWTTTISALEKRLGTIRVPTLWVQGKLDQSFTVEGTREMFDMIAATDKTLKFFPKVDHINIIDAAAEYITEWLVAHITG